MQVRRRATPHVFFLLAGFWSENDKESPPRERLENRASQEASSQERPPDKCSLCFLGARHQSSRRWEQGPEGTQDDTTGEGEVSGPIPEGEALRSSLAAPRSRHLLAPHKGGESSGAGRLLRVLGGRQPALPLSFTLNHGSILLVVGPKLWCLGAGHEQGASEDAAG